MIGVAVQVVEKVVFGGVRREVGGEWEMRKLAEGFGEVKVEAVIRAVAPEVGDAVRPLEDDGGHRETAKRSGDGEARWSGADDDRTTHDGDPSG